MFALKPNYELTMTFITGICPNVLDQTSVLLLEMSGFFWQISGKYNIYSLWGHLESGTLQIVLFSSYFTHAISARHFDIALPCNYLHL